MSELTGLPGEGPATLPGVRRYLRYKAGDTQDDTELETIVAATNAMVRTFPVCAASVGADSFTADVVRGADMLAGRLFRRRESPAGVAAFGELGPVYVMRNDPDVAMLLRLGSWSLPEVG
jgi:hypothetical protein